MADYQEYRRRILHRRWRRMFITAALLILLVLLAAVGVLWKRLHREPAPQYGPRPHHSAAGADRQRVEHHQLHPRPDA